MSTANEPDEQHGDDAGTKASGNTASAKTPSGSATRPEVVPPWQRGPGGNPQSGPGDAGRPGPPPRGVVSGTPGDDGATRSQKPLNKLDAAGIKANGPTSESFIESPTRNIDRASVATQNLPDLDAIHHAEAAKAAKVVATPARTAPSQVGPGRALRASVQIRRVDPWAMFKISAVLSIVGFFVWLISVAVLYLILDGMGVWDQVNSSFGTLTTADGSAGGGDIFGAGTIFGWAVALGAINAILLTALATIGAFIYNLCADLIGGAEVTLADLD